MRVADFQKAQKSTFYIKFTPNDAGIDAKIGKSHNLREIRAVSFEIAHFYNMDEYIILINLNM